MLGALAQRGDAAAARRWLQATQLVWGRSRFAGLGWVRRVVLGIHLVMNFNGEPPDRWFVDRNPHLNDVHQMAPNENSCPFYGFPWVVKSFTLEKFAVAYNEKSCS